MLDALPVEEDEDLVDEAAVMAVPVDEKSFEIRHLDEGQWQVVGVAIERAAQMTNWDYYEATMRFQRILRAMGITDALRKAGVQDGDTVQIGTLEMVWGYEALEDI
jgi:GTP-binding protein